MQQPSLQKNGITWLAAFEPIEHRWGFSLCSDGNRVYLFGGRTIESPALSDCWAFDSKASVWSRIEALGPVPIPVSGSILACSGSKLYMFGGVSLDERSNTKLYELDIGSRSWISSDRGGVYLSSMFFPGCIRLQFAVS